MALNRFGIGVILSARDLATPLFRKVRTDFAKTGKTMEADAGKMNEMFRTLGGGLAIAAAGFGGLSVMKNVADIADEFQFEMAAVNQIMRATPETFRQLESAAIDAGSALTFFSPRETAKGLRLFAQAGFDAAAAIEMLNPTLDMAAASLGQLGLDQSAGLAVQGVKLFTKEGMNTQQIMDRMAQATMMSSLQFKDLPLAVGVAGRGVIAFNAGIEDTLIGLGLIRNIIPTVERGATALSTTMERIVSPKTREMLKNELGVSIVNSNNKLKDFLDIIGEITIATSKWEPEMRGSFITLAFGRRSMAGMLALMRQLETKALDLGGGFEGMKKALETLRAEMKNADGAMSKLRDELLNTFKGQKQVLSASKEALASVVGLRSFIPVLKPIVDLTARFITGLARAFEMLPAGVQKALGVVMLLASAFAIITGSVVTIMGIIALITFLEISIVAIATGVAYVGAAFLALGAIIGSVATMWTNNIGGMQDVFVPFVARVFLFFKLLKSLVTTGGFSNALKKEFGGSGNTILKWAIKVYMIFARVKKFLSGVFEGFSEAYAGLEIGELINSIWLHVADALGEVWLALVEVFDAFSEITGGATSSKKSWKDFGKTVGQVLGAFLRVGVAIIKVVMVPLVFFLKLAITFVRTFIRVLRPLIGLVVNLGAAFWALLTGNFDEVFKRLKKAFFSFVEFIVEMLKGAVLLILKPIADIMNMILGEGHAFDFLNDAVKVLERPTLIGKEKAALGAADAREALIATGQPIPGAKSVGPSAAATVGSLPPGMTNEQLAAFQAEERTKRDREITLINKNYVDGVMVKETIERVTADDRKRAGGNGGATFSLGGYR